MSLRTGGRIVQAGSALRGQGAERGEHWRLCLDKPVPQAGPGEQQDVGLSM